MHNLILIICIIFLICQIVLTILKKKYSSIFFFLNTIACIASIIITIDSYTKDTTSFPLYTHILLNGFYIFFTYLFSLIMYIIARKRL